ncbi:MAG: DNA polymerase III subunit delta [Melioribacteraceae bacterium]
MGKRKESVESIYACVANLKEENLLPIYFFFGSDAFTISSAVKKIEKIAEPFTTSDFDKEKFTAEKKANISNLIDLAYTFPFGSEKKIVIVKNFENYNDKKKFLSYIESPSETSILVLINNGKVNLSVEPFKSLNKKKYIFEARELKGPELEGWVKKRSEQLKLNISSENIKALLDIVGEDKSLLEMQLQKIKSFTNDEKEITPEVILSLSSKTKQNTIFELLNVIGKGNKPESLKVITNLLDNGSSLVAIIAMLTKYFTVIAQSFEVRKMNDWDASKAINVNKFYYTNCKNAYCFTNHKRLLNAIRVLYKTDLTLKTTAVNEKTLATLMLSQLFIN